MQYTDDSAMSKDLAESLIECNGLDLTNLSRKFVKSYYKEPYRGYGSSVITVIYYNFNYHSHLPFIEVK